MDSVTEKRPILHIDSYETADLLYGKAYSKHPYWDLQAQVCGEDHIGTTTSIWLFKGANILLFWNVCESSL